MIGVACPDDGVEHVGDAGGSQVVAGDLGRAVAIDDLLASSRLGTLGLIDAQAVRAELGKGAAGVPIRLGAFDTVIGVELWLRSTEVDTQVTSIATGGSRALPT